MLSSLEKLFIDIIHYPFFIDVNALKQYKSEDVLKEFVSRAHEIPTTAYAQHDFKFYLIELLREHSYSSHYQMFWPRVENKWTEATLNGGTSCIELALALESNNAGHEIVNGILKNVISHINSSNYYSSNLYHNNIYTNALTNILNCIEKPYYVGNYYHISNYENIVKTAVSTAAAHLNLFDFVNRLTTGHFGGPPTADRILFDNSTFYKKLAIYKDNHINLDFFSKLYTLTYIDFHPSYLQDLFPHIPNIDLFMQNTIKDLDMVTAFKSGSINCLKFIVKDLLTKTNFLELKMGITSINELTSWPDFASNNLSQHNISPYASDDEIKKNIISACGVEVQKLFLFEKNSYTEAANINLVLTCKNIFDASLTAKGEELSGGIFQIPEITSQILSFLQKDELSFTTSILAMRMHLKGKLQASNKLIEYVIKKNIFDNILVTINEGKNSLTMSEALQHNGSEILKQAKEHLGEDKFKEALGSLANLADMLEDIAPLPENSAEEDIEVVGEAMSKVQIEEIE